MDGRDNGRATRRFFEVSTAGDVDTLRTLVASDAVIWRNNGRGPGPFTEEFPRIQKLRDRVGRWHYRDVRLTVGDSSACEQHTVVFEREGNGEVTIEVCVVIQYDEQGLVTRLDEYLNPSDLEALRN